MVKTENILIIGSGDELSIALELLSRDLNVYYFFPREDISQWGEGLYVGFGFSSFGLHLLSDFYSFLSNIKEQDKWLIIVSGDSYGDLPLWLRDDGWSVFFGSSYKIKQIKSDSEKEKKFLMDNGIDVPSFEVFSNLNEVVEYLIRAEEKRFLLRVERRSDIFLDVFDTLVGYPSELLSRIREVSPSKMGVNLGFLLEEFPPGVRVTTTAFFNGRDFLTPIMRIYSNPWGGYISWFEKCPLFNKGLSKLSIALKELEYHGLVSLDGIYVGGDVYSDSEYAPDIYLGSSIRFGLDIFSRAFFKMIINLLDVIHATAHEEDIKIELMNKDAFLINAFDNLEGRPLSEVRPVGDLWKIERDSPGKYGISFDRVIMMGETIMALPGESRMFQLIGFGNSYIESLSRCMQLLRLCGVKSKFEYNKDDLLMDIRDRVILLQSWLDRRVYTEEG